MRDNGGNFWTGFFIGAAIGAAAGLTFTPMSGRELRERMSGYGSQVRTRASQVPSGVQQTVQETTTRSRGYLESVRSRLSQAVQAGREAAREKRVELQSEVQAVTEPKPSM